MRVLFSLNKQTKLKINKQVNKQPTQIRHIVDYRDVKTKMARIADLKNFFNNPEKQIEEVYKEQKCVTLKIDRDIASFMGALHPEQIGII